MLAETESAFVDGRILEKTFGEEKIYEHHKREQVRVESHAKNLFHKLTIFSELISAEKRLTQAANTIIMENNGKHRVDVQ